MKFASLLATLSLAASTFAVYVTSADGTKIWAEATGNPKKPAVVFIPGFSCSSLAFDKQWSDPLMTSNLYMVRGFFFVFFFGWFLCEFSRCLTRTSTGSL